MDLHIELVRWFDLAACFLLVLARIGGLLWVAPILGDLRVPMVAKAGLSLGLALVLTPLVRWSPGTANGGWYVLALMTETGLGLAIGFVYHLFFEVVRFGGDLIGRTAGFSASEMFDPDTAEMTGPLGDLFHFTLALLFLATDGHHQLIAALGRSLQLVPPGAAGLAPGLPGALAGLTQASFLYALGLSLPIFVGLMALTVVDAVVARAVPQVNIMHITFITKMLAALALLHIGLPSALAFFGLILGGAYQALSKILPLLAGS